MPNSERQKLNYGQRRELRLRRDKTAAMLLAYFLGRATVCVVGAEEKRVAWAVPLAVEAADALIVELDRTRKDLAPDFGE